MSLGGLDAPAVNDAYQAALTEAGGWLLVKYISRDEVEILGRGTGGFPEASATVAQYSDKSPLYGFLVYRRRKVVVKYVPEGTSRLLLARTTVHFQAIIDHFSPHDAVFNASSPADFTEAAISSTCSLHTPNSFRLSSGGSVNRQGLGEITEDVEEPTTNDAAEHTTKSFTFDTMEAMAAPGFFSEAPIKGSTLDAQEASYATAADIGNSRDLGHELDQGVETGVSPMNESDYSNLKPSNAPQLPEVLVSSFNISMDRVNTPQNLSYDHLPEKSLKEPVSPSSESRNFYDYASRANTERPEPSLSSRPGTSELFSNSFMGGRTKKKLFPRPAEQLPEKQNSFRHKLPAGIRMAFQRKDDDRPKSSKSRRHKSEKGAQNPPLTSDILSSKLNGHNITESHSKTRTSAKVRDENAVVASTMPMMTGASEKWDNSPPEGAASAATKESSQRPVSQESTEPFPSWDVAPESKPKRMTPEKERLMKALQLRNQQIRAKAFAQDLSDISTPLVTVEENKPTSFAREEPLDASTKVDSGIDLDHAQAPVTNGDIVHTNKEETKSELPEIKANSPLLSVTTHNTSYDGLPAIHTEATKPQKLVQIKEDTARDTLEDPFLIKPNQEKTDGDASKIVKAASRKEKRRGVVDPLTVQIPDGASDDEYMSEDSFIHELQSAKVQEAKPVPVPKASGVSLPHDASGQRRPSNTSVTSVIIKANKTSPVATRPESKLPTGMSRQESIGIANRGNVSSGISRRIKALAEISNRELLSYNPGPMESSSPFAARNQSLYSPSRPPSFVPSAMTEMAPTSPRLQFSMLSPQSAKYRQTDTMSLYSQYGRQPENISVTARIVRDHRSANPLSRSISHEEEGLSLHRSQLIIDQHPPGHKRWISKDVPPEIPPPSVLSSQRPLSRDSEVTAITRKSRESTWRSMGRRRNESKTAPPAARSVASFQKPESISEKRQSISSRFYNRMSGLSGGRHRKNSTDSNNDHELNIVSPGPPPPVIVGDLNVQFPDSLLWRRRWVEVDTRGNLILSVSKSNQYSQGLAKKYNLSEFKPPRVPSPERQELPNSVVFDHISGSTLQLACEDVISQNQAFRRLKDIHRAWMMYEH